MEVELKKADFVKSFFIKIKKIYKFNFYMENLKAWKKINHF